jgi:hypothetical protein
MRLEDPSFLDFLESRFSGRSTIEDAASLTVAFRGAEGVFVLVPPNFDPEPGFPEARAIGAALRSALESGAAEARGLSFHHVIPAREHGAIPSFARQAGADGGYSGYWETGRCLAARTVERPPRGGIGRTAPRDCKRDRRCIHEGPGPVSTNANRAARFLGGTFQVAGGEEPTASDADAEWL